MKKILILLFIFSASIAHAATIIPLPYEEGLFAKVWRCKWRISCYQQKLGATITTIAATDTIRNSRSTINTNFTNLNNDKTEVSSSSVAAITTLSNLVTVGTLTSGSLGSGFTAVVVARGGTGSSTLSSNQVLLGNGTGAVSVVSGLGTSGQTLQSQGAGSPPIWAADTTDQATNYTWSGNHVWTAASSTFVNGISVLRATSTNATSTNLQVSGLASTSQMTVGALGVGVATTTQRNAQIAGDVQISGILNVAGDQVGAVKFLATPVNSIDRTTFTSGTFTDVDITSTTTPDLARFAILNAELRVTLTTCGSGDGGYVRFRQNGSSITANLPRLMVVCHANSIINVGSGTFLVPVDSGEIFEYDISVGPLTGTTPNSMRLIIDTVGWIE